jgi:hypothetical protein
MGNTHYGDVYSRGALLTPVGIPMTYGKYFFVDADNGNDGNDGLSMNRAKKTIAAAYALTTTNRDDVIVLSTNAVHTLTAMLDVSKNRVHFVGESYGRMYGQRARIYMGVTTAATDVHMVKNTGVGNTFTGIKFWDDNTLATYHTSCVGEGGEYALYANCEFYSSVNLTSDTFAEVLLNGDSTQFLNCTFGSLADAVSGNKVRPAVITTVGGVASALSGGVSRDVFFDGCRFWKQAGGTTTAHVLFPSDASLERLCEFHDCQFIAAHLGSTPAVAIACTATMTNGQILLTGDTSCVHCTKLATATGVISCLNAKVAATQIGIQIAG